MKRYKFIIVLLLTNFFVHLIASSGITFEHNSGRLGDTLLDYAKNFYIAQKYGLELYIHDGIPYLEDFILDDRTPRLTPEIQSVIVNRAHIPREYHSPFDRIKHIKNDVQIENNSIKTLYKSEFYIAVDGIADLNLFHSHMFRCSIEQPLFGNEIKERLTPKKTFDYVLPDNIPSIAIHIRKGGGFDKPLASDQYRPTNLQSHNGTRTCRYAYVDRSEPFKFPPEQYYLDQLLFLYDLLEQQPLYVYIFTDDKDPAALAQRIAERLIAQGINNITLDYRKEMNRHNMNMMQDVYFMSKFDYLIKSGSHFPWIAQMIGNHKAIISPVGYVWRGDYLDVTKPEIVIPDRKNHIFNAMIADFNAIPYIRLLLADIAQNSV